MDDKQRRDRIVQYLRIKPINHGQIYTYQIAIPQDEIREIPQEKAEYLRNSLTEQGTNLIPLIVRRTEAYTEEEEYEVIYGADWCLTAKALDIEKLWVWVFDLTDEQAITMKAEMEHLLGFPAPEQQYVTGETDVSELLERKLKPIHTKINQISASLTENVGKSAADQQLKLIDSKIENLASAVEILSTLVKQILEQPKSLKQSKLNLITASESEIKDRLLENGINTNQVKAALKAIAYWKSASGLTWENLKKSTTKNAGEHKISGFGVATYKKLKEHTEITS